MESGKVCCQCGSRNIYTVLQSYFKIHLLECNEYMTIFKYISGLSLVVFRHADFEYQMDILIRLFSLFIFLEII